MGETKNWLPAFQAAGVAFRVHWWPIWCAADCGRKPLPSYYSHIGEAIGYPVSDDGRPVRREITTEN